MIEKQDKAFSYLARNEEDRLLLSRVGDYMQRAERGNTAVSDFLNLGEQYLVRAYLQQCGMREGEHWLFWGGYPFAERRMLFLFPAYLTESIYPTTAENPLFADLLLSYAQAEEALGALSVTGSGYQTLSHRDYLGALLALGIERFAVGDIAVFDTSHAVLFAKNTILSFVGQSLSRVGNDKVQIRYLTQEEAAAVPDCRHYDVITDTAASLRLDAIVAICTNLSREKAKALITAGMVEVDFRPQQSPDLLLDEGAVLSIRGFGRYIFDTQNGVSKKGRLRVVLKKLI